MPDLSVTDTPAELRVRVPVPSARGDTGLLQDDSVQILAALQVTCPYVVSLGAFSSRYLLRYALLPPKPPRRC